MLYRFIFLCFSFVHSLLLALSDEFILNDENPCLFHHVNVITGHLNCHFLDIRVEGEVPITIARGYSSSGGLEKDKNDFDLRLKELRGGFLIQGGWNLFSHTNLLLYHSKNGSIKAYLAEPQSGLITYDLKDEVSEDEVVLIPNVRGGQCSGTISARGALENYRLRINHAEGMAELLIPDGGKRKYFRVIHEVKNKDIAYENVFYRLVEEILPSGHIIDYFYDRFTRLTRIETKSPDRKQTYAWIDINVIQSMAPMSLEIKTSDGQTIKYRGSKIDERDYISHIKKDENVSESIKYEKLGPDTGAFLKEIYRGKNLFFAVDYYAATELDDLPKATCKVKSLYLPHPETGRKTHFASFEYEEDLTQVRDCNDVLTKYFHREGLIHRIEKYDETNQLHSIILFLWKERKLIAKVIVDPQELGVLSKTFEYDENGNVIKDILSGDLTGQREGRFAVDEQGQLVSADHLTKSYRFDGLNRLIEESQEGGVVYAYEYFSTTDLIKSKFTFLDDEIFGREFFFYDKNNLLVKEVNDDGKTIQFEELTGFNHRRIKEYIRHEKNGTVLEALESCVSLDHPKPCHNKKVINQYDQNLRLITQHHYLYDDHTAVSINYSYDKLGRVIKRKDHLGREEYYEYDQNGNLSELKEIGQPLKKMRYDLLGRVNRTKIEGSKTEIANVYDLKGNPILSKDELGKITQQEYNGFGLCYKTILSSSKSSRKIEIGYTYDIQGNLEKIIDPFGYEQITKYTALRKPKEIIKKDGSKIRYFYTKTGLLSKMIYPDLSYLVKKYDPLERLIKEELFSEDDQIVSAEVWEYDGLLLKAHQSASGLVTTYTYDDQGRKTQEQSEDRVIEYEYNTLDLVTKIVHPDYEEVLEYDSVGRKIRSYEIDHYGKIEKERTYQYNDENLLIQSTILTACGYASDQFFYDERNRLIKHVDPEGNFSEIDYIDEVIIIPEGSLIKKTTRPNGKITYEYFDFLMRLIRIEVKDQEGETYEKNEYFYDDLGNQIEVIINVFDQGLATKSHKIEFLHDCLGQKIEEIEDGISRKRFEYDSFGRVKQVLFPSGKAMNYDFDERGRLKILSSRKQKIKTIFEYEDGNHPTMIIDAKNNLEITRKYSSFGELIYEKDALGLTQTWMYDHAGRVLEHVYPDESSISYEYDKHLNKLEKRDRFGQLVLKHDFLEYGLSGLLEVERYHLQNSFMYHRYDRLNRIIASYGAHFQQSCSYNSLGQMNEYINSNEQPKEIQYDILGQINQEGQLYYQFDSLGNPRNATTLGIGQIKKIDDTELTYDVDGNVISKKSQGNVTNYHYDEFNRLICIECNNEKTQLFYDPLSRLIQISKSFEEEYLFYFQDEDIGTLDGNGKMTSLKINRASHFPQYIQLNDEIKIPITDFQGNIRGLLNLDGSKFDYVSMNFFGEGNASRCPWSFSGKRKIEGLFYFLERFYDPEIKRWMTPDASGYCEGFNLYAYVLNDPANRIDLFGLNSQELILQDLKIPIPMRLLMDLGESKGVISCRGYIGSAQVDWMVSCGHWHRLKFTPEEVESGVVNIAEHFPELVPNDGRLIGMITAQNGIMTTREDFETFSHSISRRLDEGVLFLGLHNPTEGVFRDVNRAAKEITFQETFAVSKTRQFMEAMVMALDKVNPDLIWTHIVHSEAGAIARVALENMHPEAKQKVKHQMKIFALAPAMPIPNHIVLEAENVYSDLDFITGLMGRIFSKSKNYNITFKDCLSNFQERSFLFSDHAFLGKTYRHAISCKLDEERRNFNLR